MAKLQTDDNGLALTDNTGKPLVKTTGSVLQVVSSTNTTQSQISSTTFIATHLSAVITPSRTSSKILIIAHGSTNTPGGGATHSIHTIFLNNTTNLGNAEFGMGNLGSLSGGELPFEAFYSINYLHSPNTTSSTTYTVYGRQYSNGIGTFNLSSRTSSITLMEIAG